MNKNELHKHVLELASQSPCSKRKVGCVIVEVVRLKGQDDRYIIAAEGFNYHPDLVAKCELPNGETDPMVIHAEIAACHQFSKATNAEARQSANFKVFVTHQPCANCMRAILDLGFDVKDIEVVEAFMKFDSNKPRFGLIPPSLAEGVAKVLTYGAKKYKPNNWRNTKDIECYISALERHKTAWLSGEEFDPESGLHHLEHMACNIAFLIELKHLPKVKEL